MQHHDVAASPWVARWATGVAAGSRVLDVACGTGRHAQLFAARGCKVIAVDRDPTLLAAMRGAPNIDTVVADLETDAWPFAQRQFDAIVVTNYLHRPLFAALTAALAPDALLIYETFAAGNEVFGRPSNPAFLLRPRELLDALGTNLRVLAFEDGYIEYPKPAMIQRIAARRVEPHAQLAAERCGL